MPLALQIDRRKQLLKIPFFVRVFPGCWRTVGKAPCWDKSYARSKTKCVGKCSQSGFHFQSLCEVVGRSKTNPMNPKAMSVHHCRFSSWVILASSREGGVGTVLGLVHHSHQVCSSWRLPLNCMGSQVRTSVCWMKQGALGWGNRQEGPPNSLGWMLVLPHDEQQDG